jgi:hypothetical protein
VWKLKNSEGTEWLCRTLDQVNQIVLNAPIILKYTLKFIPIYESQAKKSLREQQQEEPTLTHQLPVPLSRSKD